MHIEFDFFLYMQSSYLFSKEKLKGNLKNDD